MDVRVRDWGGEYSSPIVVNGIVYVGTEDGHLRAFHTRGSGTSQDSLVLIATLEHHNRIVHADPATESTVTSGVTVVFEGDSAGSGDTEIFNGKN